MELPGIDPGTSHMQSERSTIWATAPDVELADSTELLLDNDVF